MFAETFKKVYNKFCTVPARTIPVMPIWDGQGWRKWRGLGGILSAFDPRFSLPAHDSVTLRGEFSTVLVPK